ncbi:hypothetical protein GCK72_001085 [Caenorhabditis remanei]|uniref:Uncharacterized protein n=1 Tax=Caenorhabditis remanei TaxID=31234 RepID=A0A6A5HNM8_CAERE|nr:hypothetical protein GCK72_001085 [Caenorhabditis remanei]KAF1769269.1 hypothetical protein GCK72_001085 [Caenorhabditis remanei]
MGVGTTTIRLSCGLANAVIDKTLHEMEAQVWQNFTNFLWNHMEFVDDDIQNILATMVTVGTTDTLFSYLLIHVIIVATLLSYCNNKKKIPLNSDMSEGTDRPPGGGNESIHFTPPHIGTAAPGPSVLRHKPTCPVHCQFSEDESTAFVDSAPSSDIEMDSTQSMSLPSSRFSNNQCTCFCAQKRVRFQCPNTNSKSQRAVKKYWYSDGPFDMKYCSPVRTFSKKLNFWFVYRSQSTPPSEPPGTTMVSNGDQHEVDAV